MTYEHILVNAEDGVGTLTLNRPDKLNAMNRQLSSELHNAVKLMDADEAIGCIVITGAGERAFSAGGDIHEQREDDRRYTDEELDAHRPPRRGAYEIAACAKPTIRASSIRSKSPRRCSRSRRRTASPIAATTATATARRRMAARSTAAASAVHGHCWRACGGPWRAFGAGGYEAEARARARRPWAGFSGHWSRRVVEGARRWP